MGIELKPCKYQVKVLIKTQMALTLKHILLHSDRPESHLYDYIDMQL